MAIIPIPLPYVFVNGTTIDATQVNADLNTIVNAVNANAAPLVGGANAISFGCNFNLPTGAGAVTVLAGSFNVASMSFGGPNVFTITLNSSLPGSGKNPILIIPPLPYSGGSLAFGALAIGGALGTQVQFAYYNYVGTSVLPLAAWGSTPALGTIVGFGG